MSVTRAAGCGGGMMGKDGRNAERVTTTLPRVQEAEVDRIAARGSVKLAWLARRAGKKLLEPANGGPLFPLELGADHAKH